MEKLEINPTVIIKEFDRFLLTRKAKFSGIVIGAGALHIMGINTRQTIDIDVLDPTIPTNILKLAEEFRLEMAKQGIQMIPKWINNGPASLVRDLPEGWQDRTTEIFKGDSITLLTLGRSDLLISKFFAYCDRNERDLEDLKNLDPSVDELRKIIPIVQTLDGNPGWPRYVEEKFRQLAKELGHEL